MVHLYTLVLIAANNVACCFFIGQLPVQPERSELELPITVDANVNRTQSLSTRRNGQRMLRTVTSLDEMISLDKTRRKRVSDQETDSGELC